MSRIPSVIRLGTRGSALARWQTNYVQGLLAQVYPGLVFEISVITTRGDQVLDTPLPLVGGKGVFTAELEAALRSGEIDLAVHSLKDLPIELPADLVIGAIPARADPRDVLVSRQGDTLSTLPRGAAIGSSSTRRAAQLKHRRPDLNILDIRGNVDTRLRKALEPAGAYEGVILAKAGVERLGYLDAVSEVLALDVLLPAPGQGALAVQCRDEAAVRDLLAPISHAPTRLAVTAERAFLAGLGGGCAVPVAAYAALDDRGRLALRGRISAPGVEGQIDVSGTAPGTASLNEAHQLGIALAQQALRQGASEILAHFAGQS